MKPITVDLEAPPADRWLPVLARRKKNTKRLISRAVEQLPRSNIVTKAIALCYRTAGTEYTDELQGISNYLNADQDELMALQLVYELSHVADRLGQITPLLGCTSVINPEPRGLTHTRTLDWGLSPIKAATALTKFKRGKRMFVAATIPGFLGLLTGMVPGAYSVSINYAPPPSFPGPGASPPLLVRHVLETCDTYAAAVNVLKKTPLTTSVFFTVCGVTAGCVIERTREDYSVRYARDSVAVTNHYISRHTPNATPAPYDSEIRYRAAISAIRGIKAPAGIARAFRRAPIQNRLTQQRIKMVPATGVFTLF
jgi:predicted choloylglycine hydrolase